MELRDLVSIYEGPVRFFVTDFTETDGVVPVISFNNGEHEALREDLLTREVKDFRVEVSSSMDIGKKVSGVTIIICLADANAGTEVTE